MRKLLCILSLLVLWGLAPGSLYAQQDPHYTQYRYNLSVVNPAYAGSQGLWSTSIMYRRQWSSLEGAPVTYTLASHSPFNEKVGVGLSVIRDQLGPVEETNIYGDFSYTIPVGQDNYLSFGLKAGVTLHDVGLSDLFVLDPLDPFFTQDISNAYPNVGVGLFYSTWDYFISFSIPNLINAVHLDENGLKYGSEVSHFFLAGGLVHQLSDQITIRPSTMIKGAFGAPWSFDLNFNMLFLDTVEAGVSYRLNDSFSGLLGVWVNDTVRIGYAYDGIISPLSAGALSSHEIILSFDLQFKDNSRGVPPRFL
jgi:type IX secretion system PorP/SprF family membrane protein